MAIRRPAGWLAAGAILATAAVGGCAAEPASADDAQFWRGVSVDAASEVDPPGSLDELADAAATIVRGTVVDVVDVPAAVSGIPESDPVVALVVEVDDVLRGDATEATVKVVRPREPAVSVEQIASSIPDGAALFFLEPAGYGDYFAATSDLGIVGELDGEATTLLDPNLTTNVIPPGTTLADIARSITN